MDQKLNKCIKILDMKIEQTEKPIMMENPPRKEKSEEKMSNDEKKRPPEINCLKCKLNDWSYEFDNGLEIYTCKTKGCGFKSFWPCKDLQSWGDVQLCKHTHSSCNKIRIAGKCPKSMKNNLKDTEKKQTKLF